MTSARDTVVAMVPPSARRFLRTVHRKLVFRRAMHAFLRDPAAIAASPGNVLADLVYGWGNEGWSGQDEYLRDCLRYALASKGPILECGSGLTTVLAGAVAQRRGLHLWSLEHLPEWADRVRRLLQRYGIASVHVCTVPLKDYGGFDWYAPPLASMPRRFATVICDGPPSATRGGRYGLVPVMKQRLGLDCTILLDDAAREQEQATARRWFDELPLTCEVRGSLKPYFLMTRKRIGVRDPLPLRPAQSPGRQTESHAGALIRVGQSEGRLPRQRSAMTSD